MPARRRSSARRPPPGILDIMRAQSLARRSGRVEVERQLADVVAWFHRNRNEGAATDLALGPLGVEHLWGLVETAGEAAEG